MSIKQTGFTLIELIMVIIVLGIIAAVAIPKYVDLSSQATGAKTNYNAASNAENAAAMDACNKATTAAGTSNSKCQ